MNLASFKTALGFALAMGAVHTTAHAQFTDVGDVIIDVEQGMYTKYGRFDFGSGWIDGGTMVGNGIQWPIGLETSASSFSGFSDGSALELQLGGTILPDEGLGISGYTLTINGTVSATGTGRATLSAYVADPKSVISESWAHTQASGTPFSWTHTFEMTHTHATVAIFAGTEASYSGSCTDGFFGGCSYQQGMATLQITDVQLHPTLIPAIPAVPEPDLIWMALAGVALVAARSRRRAV